MLLLGVLLGFGGVITAIWSFTNIHIAEKATLDAATTITLIKCALLLIFIETFCFFFLKQYRIMFNEHKLFYSLELRMLNYIHILENGRKLTDKQELLKKINDMLANEKFDLYELNAKSQINEFDNANLIKLIEIIKKT